MFVLLNNKDGLFLFSLTGGNGYERCEMPLTKAHRVVMSILQ